MHNIHLCGHCPSIFLFSCQSVLLPASVHLITTSSSFFSFSPVFTTSSSLSPRFPVSSTSDKEINIQRRSCVWWVSSTDGPMRKIQTLRSLYLRLYLLVIAERCCSLCLRGRSMWWWSSETQPLCCCFLSVVLVVTTPSSLLCVDVDASEHMYCIFPASETKHLSWLVFSPTHFNKLLTGQRLVWWWSSRFVLIILISQVLTENISQTHTHSQPENIIFTHPRSCHRGCSGRHVAVWRSCR